MPKHAELPSQDDRLDNFLLQAALGLVTGYEVCFTPFLRSHMGSRYLGCGALGSICMLWLWMECYPAPELMPFACLWTIVAVWQKIHTAIDNARGRWEHRQYGGDSLISALPLLGRCNEMAIKCLIEPGLIFLVSFGMAELSPALGDFFIWGSLVMAITANLGRAFRSEQIAAIRDGAITARAMAFQQRQTNQHR